MDVSCRDRCGGDCRPDRIQIVVRLIYKVVGGGGAVSAECVGYKVGFAGDMLKVCGEFGDCCQMSLLPWTVWIRNLLDGRDKGLVICVHSEKSAFKEITKMAN